MPTTTQPGREVATSAYRHDQRVRFNPDGTVVLPDTTGGRDGNWHLEPADGGGWTVCNDADQGYITDEGDRTNQRRKVFATLDGALFHILGDPQQ